MTDNQQHNIIIYTSVDGQAKLEVRMEDSSVWLSQAQMAELFQKDVRTINEHIINIFEEGELCDESVIRKFRITAADGKNYETKHYNLDVIISVGYRVKSQHGTQFRIWATQKLREYIVKGFVLDDDRLAEGKKFGYFDELLERIRAIRASERNFYQKITDIYATSIDYASDADTTKTFFATIQNKIHFAVHGHTAAEIISKRADATKKYMGLTNFKGRSVRERDITVAKNYLTESELKQLNLV